MSNNQWSCARQAARREMISCCDAAQAKRLAVAVKISWRFSRASGIRLSVLLAAGLIPEAGWCARGELLGDRPKKERIILIMVKLSKHGRPSRLLAFHWPKQSSTAPPEAQTSGRLLLVAGVGSIRSGAQLQSSILPSHFSPTPSSLQRSSWRRAAKSHPTLLGVGGWPPVALRALADNGVSLGGINKEACLSQLENPRWRQSLPRES